MSTLNDRVKAATSDDPPQAATDVAARDRQLNWLKGHQTYFVDALPRHVDQLHFMSVARSILPKLKNCTDASIIQALLACARFGLEPDGRQAAIVPYKTTATFQPMYEGYIELMYRSPRVDSVHFSWIREKDRWTYTPTAPSPHDFLHQPRVELPEDERGPVVLAYAFAWIGGHRSQVIILNRQQAEAIRDKYSGAYKKAERDKTNDSPWHTDFDAMWAKSCVRRLVKVVPTSTELADLVRADDDADDIASNAPTVIRGSVVHHDSPAADNAWPVVTEPGSGADEDKAGSR